MGRLIRLHKFCSRTMALWHGALIEISENVNQHWAFEECNYKRYKSFPFAYHSLWIESSHTRHIPIVLHNRKWKISFEVRANVMHKTEFQTRSC